MRNDNECIEGNFRCCFIKLNPSTNEHYGGGIILIKINSDQFVGNGGRLGIIVTIYLRIYV